MKDEGCLKEQAMGDLMFDGINGPTFWLENLKYISLTDMIIVFNIDIELEFCDEL